MRTFQQWREGAPGSPEYAAVIRVYKAVANAKGSPSCITSELLGALRRAYTAGQDSVLESRVVVTTNECASPEILRGRDV